MAMDIREIAKELGRKGGRARAQKLGKGQLRAHALKMVEARKAKKSAEGVKSCGETAQN